MLILPPRTPAPVNTGGARAPVGRARIVLRAEAMPSMRFYAALLGLVLAGCPAEEETPAGGCREDAVPAGFDATTPTSFAKDVMPVFETSCAFSSCHGSNAGSANGIYLGSSDPAATRKALLDTKAERLPSMPLVTPGDPGKSFLVRKIEGTQCALDAQCTGGTCGRSMPQGQDLLPEAARFAIRRWVAQGAKED